VPAASRPAAIISGRAASSGAAPRFLLTSNCAGYQPVTQVTASTPAVAALERPLTPGPPGQAAGPSATPAPPYLRGAAVGGGRRHGARCAQGSFLGGLPGACLPLAAGHPPSPKAGGQERVGSGSSWRGGAGAPRGRTAGGAERGAGAPAVGFCSYLGR